MIEPHRPNAASWSRWDIRSVLLLHACKSINASVPTPHPHKLHSYHMRRVRRTIDWPIQKTESREKNFKVEGLACIAHVSTYIHTYIHTWGLDNLLSFPDFPSSSNPLTKARWLSSVPKIPYFGFPTIDPLPRSAPLSRLPVWICGTSSGVSCMSSSPTHTQ